MLSTVPSTSDRAAQQLDHPTREPQQVAFLTHRQSPMN